MNLLLDTHVALWAIADSPKLVKKAREMIASPNEPIRLITHDPMVARYSDTIIEV